MNRLYFAEKAPFIINGTQMTLMRQMTADFG
jgi:hypothetical protein